MHKRGSSHMLDLDASEMGGNTSFDQLHYLEASTRVCTATARQLSNGCTRPVADDKFQPVSAERPSSSALGASALETAGFARHSGHTHQRNARDVSCSEQRRASLEGASTPEPLGCLQRGGRELYLLHERDLLNDVAVEDPAVHLTTAFTGRSFSDDIATESVGPDRCSTPPREEVALPASPGSPISTDSLESMDLDHAPFLPSIKEQHRSAKRKMATLTRALRFGTAAGVGEGGEETKRLRTHLRSSFLDEPGSNGTLPPLGELESAGAGDTLKPRSVKRVLFPHIAQQDSLVDAERRSAPELSPELSSRWLR